MKCILFVDDDPAILEGMQLRLRPMRDKWDMKYVDSGLHAIEELERRRYDVILSDMRMPAMDGAQLLRIVSERWPRIVRIVLSGSADLKQTVRLLPNAHHYLSKPCEPLRLENAVERCFGLQELLAAPSLRAVLGRMRRLPALPPISARLRVALSSERATAGDVGRIVTADALIAQKTLQMVNSAAFGIGQRVTTIEQAVTYLGFVAVRNLVMCAEVCARWPEPLSHSGLDLERLQRHAYAVANVARHLAARTPHADDALLAALLHDIGYRLLIQECPRALEDAIAMAAAQRIPMYEAESRVIGSAHPEIGAYLLDSWGLPCSIVEAVAYHHAPRRVPQAGFDVLAALALAGALAPGDDADAFGSAVPADAKVGAQYLESVGAPFGWAEAERRAAQSIAVGEPIA